MAHSQTNKRDTNGEKPADLRGQATTSPLSGGARAMTRTGIDHEMMLTTDDTRPVAERRLLARRSFPGQPRHLGAARNWLAQLVKGFDAADDALLACSELAANAIVHSDSGLPGGMFTVRLSIEPDFVRIEVLDQGGPWSGRPDRIDHADADPEDQTQCGRGLTIIAAIACSWGITGDQEGRTAWCEIKSR